MESVLPTYNAPSYFSLKNLGKKVCVIHDKIRYIDRTAGGPLPFARWFCRQTVAVSQRSNSADPGRAPRMCFTTAVAFQHRAGDAPRNLTMGVPRH